MKGVQAFGRYRVTGSLGTGAMGEVYAAEDEVLGRQVAVKTLRSGASGLGARMLDERFRLEARAIASLAHPHVVQVFDIDLKADPPYIVMERVAGPSLKDRLAERTLDESELRSLGIQIGNALAAAHAAGVVHRDVKPANILAAGASTWKLADFGVAHVPDSSLTMTGQFVGSPAYAPPEAIVKGQLGPTGDVYGLGATLYQAAAGKWPRTDSESGALFAPVPPLRELVPSLSIDVADVIDRAVAIDADKRPTASELAAGLARVSAEHAVQQPIVPVRASSAPGTVIPHSAVSTPGAFDATSAVSTPGPAIVKPPLSPQAKRQIWILTIVTILIIGIIAATRSTPSPPRGAITNRPMTPTMPASDSPREIRAVPPPGLQGKAAKDWNKVIDKLYDRDYGEALRKLGDWERRYGQTAETRNLATQLESLPDEMLREHHD